MNDQVLNRTISWLNKTDGRDKFCKAVMCASRILKWHFLQNKNKLIADRFDGLFSNMSKARKLFRLFKSMNELQGILELLSKQPANYIEFLLKLCQKIFNFIYWGFDNLQILSAIQLIKQDAKELGKKAGIFWLLGLTCALIQLAREFFEVQGKIQNLESSIAEGQPQHMDKLNDQSKKIDDLYKKRFACVLNFVKNCGDYVNCMQSSTLYPTLTGKNLNDGVLGATGLLSAMIHIYQTY